MTKIKFCGLTRLVDIENSNLLKPDYIGFVFSSKSKRFIGFDKARQLKDRLDKDITAVGVFVNEKIEKVVELLKDDVIDVAQLHGNENEEYIEAIHASTHKKVIKAFGINSLQDICLAQKSPADYVLLDWKHAGSGKTFDWELAKALKRKYFLAGGLDLCNVGTALEELAPYAVDVSSGIETNGLKDVKKMHDFICAVRNKEGIND